MTEITEKESKYESDLTSYKEQIKQHSVTICAMEERISKVMKKSKDSIEESEKYRKEIQGKHYFMTYLILKIKCRSMYCFELRKTLLQPKVAKVVSCMCMCKMMVSLLKIIKVLVGDNI